MRGTISSVSMDIRACNRTMGTSLGPDLIWRDAYKKSIYRPQYPEGSVGEMFKKLRPKSRPRDAFVLIGPAKHPPSVERALSDQNAPAATGAAPAANRS